MIGIHPTAIVDEGAQIGEGTRIWHFCHVCGSAKIGQGCSLGQNVFIGERVRIGDECKLQNNVSIYEGVTLEAGVFCGPSAVFTNDLTPRARYPKGHENFVRTLVREGASIGANATIVCGHTIGKNAMIGAGAVVTADVPDHALMLGIPARQAGYVCTCGQRLQEGMTCTACGRQFRATGSGLCEVGS
ncbi:MAG: acyltransferase [Candidatus Limiplasma sp.]|nr:acyltransferase [Candidatus Limiplasma sp.]MEA5145900.1 acyltransferase [Candidatus Limiplasma sp.]